MNKTSLLLIFGTAFTGTVQSEQTSFFEAGKSHMTDSFSKDQSMLNPNAAQSQLSDSGIFKDMEKAHTNPQGTTDLNSAEALNQAKDQLKGSRYKIDPNSDPIFKNANHAQENSKEMLDAPEVEEVDESSYQIQECVETRDEEFEMTRMARIDPYYKKFHVYQFFNSCPNHRGWGKRIVEGCIARKQTHLFGLQRRQDLDYMEIHGMEWLEEDHPDLDDWISLGKCRLKEERSISDQTPRMIDIHHFQKAETMENHDWNITPLDRLEGETNSVLRSPQDFGVQGFSKTQVYTCSMTSFSSNTCKLLRERGGIEVSSRCIEEIKGVCTTWSKTYKVPSTTQRKIKKKSTFETSKIVNLEGELNPQSLEENTESVEAIAQLAAVKDSLKAMQKPGVDTGQDAAQLSVFNGQDLRCVTQGGRWSHHGCPGQRGQKTGDEQKLEILHREGKCILIGSYDDGKSNAGTMAGQKRTVTTYCCYESVLAKIFHESAIGQGLKSKGSAQSPHCGMLTLDTLQKLDWKRMDLEPFVRSSLSNLTQSPSSLTQKSTQKIQDHIQHQMQANAASTMRTGNR